MSKLEELSNEQLKDKIIEIRNDVEYLGEKLFRKQQYRSALLREMFRRNLTIVNGEIVRYDYRKHGVNTSNGDLDSIDPVNVVGVL